MIAILAAAMLSPSTPQVCALPFEVARSEAAAKAIAEVAIASSPSATNSRDTYSLNLTWVEERRSWIVVQRIVRDGVRFGGLGMEIAACDGKISDLNRQR